MILDPANQKLEKVFQKLSEYLELGYKQGTEMVICDFLSRTKLMEEEDLTNVPPIALNSLAKYSRYTGAVTRSQSHNLPEQKVPDPIMNQTHTTSFIL